MRGMVSGPRYRGRENRNLHLGMQTPCSEPFPQHHDVSQQLVS